MTDRSESIAALKALRPRIKRNMDSAVMADALALLADIVLALEEPKKPKVKPDLAYNNVTLRPHG